MVSWAILGNLFPHKHAVTVYTMDKLCEIIFSKEEIAFSKADTIILEGIVLALVSSGKTMFFPDGFLITI